MIINIFSYEEYMKDPGCLDSYLNGDDGEEDATAKII